jgi:hypothetical protein
MMMGMSNPRLRISETKPAILPCGPRLPQFSRVQPTAAPVRITNSASSILRAFHHAVTVALNLSRNRLQPLAFRVAGIEYRGAGQELEVARVFHGCIRTGIANWACC